MEPVLFEIWDIRISLYLYSVLNVKVVVGAFNQEKARVGDFSVIVKSSRTFG